MCALRLRFLSLGALSSSLLLVGCSTHPLPEDTTGLQVFDLVHKIECEAADTIKAKFESSQLGQQVSQLAKADAAIQRAAEEIQKKTEQLNKSDFGVTGEALEDADRAISLQAARLIERGQQLRDQYGPSPSDGIGLAKAKAFILEKEILEKESKAVHEAQRLLADILTSQKELEKAKKERAKRFAHLLQFQKQVMIFQFDLSAREENNATASGTLKWPLTFGTFSLNYNAGDNKTRDAQRVIKLASTFGELNALNCLDVAEEPDPRLPLRYPIRGKIGLDEVLISYMRVAFGPGADDWDGGQKFKAGGESYQDKITFTTVVNAGIKPIIDVTKGIPQVAQATLDLNAKRTDTHILTVYITPPSDDAAKATQNMIITQMPAVRVRTNVWRSPEWN